MHLARRFFPTSDLPRARPPYFVAARSDSYLPVSSYPHSSCNSPMVVLLAFIAPRQSAGISNKSTKTGALNPEATRIKNQVGNKPLRGCNLTFQRMTLDCRIFLVAEIVARIIFLECSARERREREREERKRREGKKAKRSIGIIIHHSEEESIMARPSLTRRR